jgi:hypothetical protein
MVLDILAAIGLKETGQYVAKDVLLPLLQGSLEDYAKDFFKSCITDAAGLAQQEPVQKALGKALKAFVELVEEELAFQGCTGAEIRDFYELPLRQFMQDADVKATLGRAFEPDCRAIDAGGAGAAVGSVGICVPCRKSLTGRRSASSTCGQ